MATSQKQWLNCMGFVPPSGGKITAAAYALSTADKRLALGFILPETKTINSVLAYVSDVAGTPANVKLTCEIWTDGCIDSAAFPGAIIGTQAVEVSGTITAGSWVTFAGFNTVLTYGTQYWLVFKNTSVAPTVDYPSVQYLSTMNTTAVGGGNSYFGWPRCVSTNAGVSWGTAVANQGGYRLGFSDSTYIGQPFSAGDVDSSFVYGALLAGAYFTTPAYGRLALRGASMCPGKLGTPAAGVAYKLYKGDTLVATSSTIPAANIGVAIGTPLYHPAYFSGVQYLDPSTKYRLVLSSAASEDADNAFSVDSLTLQDSAASRSCIPLSMGQCSFDGEAWTDLTTAVVPCALILDSDGEAVVETRGPFRGAF